jgi:aminopeptidase N
MPSLERQELYRRHHFSSDFEDPKVPAKYPPDLELEPVHLDINLYVDIPNSTGSGTVTTTVRARRSGPTELILDAVDFLDLKVSSPDGSELGWGYDGAKLNIRWANVFSTGEERRVDVAYRVVEPVDGLYFSKPNDAYPEQAWYAATDHETERARHWLPCIDLPNVRTTLDFHLRSDERFTILANGLLIEESVHGDGTKTAHWRLEQLCPSYLACFAIGDFVRADDGTFDNDGQQIELAYFCSREHDAEVLLRTFGRTGQMMAWMTDKLAMPFPYPKYYQFALPMMGGAMENISLVSWGDNYLLNESLASEIEWLLDSINVHEMAHSYFGDAVVIRDFAHTWLKESWATYMEQCWLEDLGNANEAQYLYYDDANKYFREADEKYRRPIVTRRFKSSWQIYDAHTYPGGACRIRTLRNELGDDVFWPAVRDYLKRYQGKVVETDDFRQVMEEHSGRSLGMFFDQWFRSPGYPDLKVSFKYDGKQKQGTFEIEQKQVDEEKGIPAFTLRTDIGWTIDGQEHRTPIKLDQAKQVVVVSMPSEPEQVRFDPGNQALYKLAFNPGDPMLRRQLREAKDVIGRIQAAEELAKTGRRANIEAVVQAYREETFWGAREYFVKALGKANTEAAIEGLAGIIAWERDPKVLMSVFEAAAEYRHQSIRDAVDARLKDALPPLARRYAYVAMGAQRQQANWDLLVEGGQQAGYNGIAQGGAFQGIAATRREEAPDLLLEQVSYGRHSNRVRPSITSALGDIGRGLEKASRERVVESLTDLLRDPWEDVRWRAASSLKKMKAVEAIPALESFSESISQQSQFVVEKMVASIREDDKVDGSPLKKQVEDLNEKVRKLEDQLQKLEARVLPAGEED